VKPCYQGELAHVIKGWERFKVVRALILRTNSHSTQKLSRKKPQRPNGGQAPSLNLNPPRFKWKREKEGKKQFIGRRVSRREEQSAETAAAVDRNNSERISVQLVQLVRRLQAMATEERRKTSKQQRAHPLRLARSSREKKDEEEGSKKEEISRRKEEKKKKKKDERRKKNERKNEKGRKQ
jgi:hypothetical protein